MLADILPTAYEVGVLNGHVRPGDTVAVVGAGRSACPPSSAPSCTRPGLIVAIDLADARLDAAKQFGADLTINNGRRGRHGGGPGAHRGSRGRRGHRGGGGPGHLRTLHRTGPARRPRGQHRRPRQAGDPASRVAVDHGRDHHHRAGRHLLHADPAAPAHRPPDRRRTIRHPPLRPRRHRWTPTTCSPGPPTPVRSRSSCPGGSDVGWPPGPGEVTGRSPCRQLVDRGLDLPWARSASRSRASGHRRVRGLPLPNRP